MSMPTTSAPRSRRRSAIDTTPLFHPPSPEMKSTTSVGLSERYTTTCPNVGTVRVSVPVVDAFANISALMPSTQTTVRNDLAFFIQVNHEQDRCDPSHPAQPERDQRLDHRHSRSFRRVTSTQLEVGGIPVL